MIAFVISVATIWESTNIEPPFCFYLTLQNYWNLHFSKVCWMNHDDFWLLSLLCPFLTTAELFRPWDLSLCSSQSSSESSSHWRNVALKGALVASKMKPGWQRQNTKNVKRCQKTKTKDVTAPPMVEGPPFVKPSPKMKMELAKITRAALGISKA